MRKQKRYIKSSFDLINPRTNTYFLGKCRHRSTYKLTYYPLPYTCGLRSLETPVNFKTDCVRQETRVFSKYIEGLRFI